MEAEKATALTKEILDFMDKLGPDYIISHFDIMKYGSFFDKTSESVSLIKLGIYEIICKFEENKEKL